MKAHQNAEVRTLRVPYDNIEHEVSRAISKLDQTNDICARNLHLKNNPFEDKLYSSTPSTLLSTDPPSALALLGKEKG